MTLASPAGRRAAEGARRLFLGLAVFLSAVPASAQVPHLPLFSEGMSSLGLQLGLAAPTATNEFDRVAGRGPAVALVYLRYPWDWIAWGAELGIFKFGKGGSSGVNSKGILVDVKGQADAMTFLALARLNLLRERSWTPYLLGGAGFNQFKLSGTATGGGTSVTLGGSSTGASLSAGAGVEAFLVRNLSLAAEARYYEFRVKMSAFPTTDSAEALAYTVGARYWFGQRR